MSCSRKNKIFHKTCKLKERKQSVFTKIYYLNSNIQSIFRVLFAESWRKEAKKCKACNKPEQHDKVRGRTTVFV